MVGIQPALTQEQRQQASAANAPPKPSAPMAAAPVVPPAAPPPEEAHPPSTTPPDGAKTIARPSPAFLQSKLGQAVAAAAAARAATPAARPSPGLPSKLAARPGAMTTPGVAPPAKVPAVRSGLAQPSPKPPSVQSAPIVAAPGAPAPAAPLTAKSNGPADGGGDDIEIELDVGAGSPNNRAVDISDDGFAEAEAALEAMQSFRLAEAALQRNDIAGAEKLAQKAVDGDPTQVDYVTLLFWIRALGNAPAAVEEAITTMTRVLAEEPSSERALLYRGKLFSRTNRYQEALADFNELLAANPQHRDAQAEVRHLKSKT